MHVSRAVDSSSLLPIGATQTEIFPGTEESHLERVHVAPLNALLDPEALSTRSLLKIDVQGYELEVLRGCETLLDGFSAVYVRVLIRRALRRGRRWPMRSSIGFTRESSTWIALAS